MVRKHDWHLTPIWQHGRELLAVRREAKDVQASYLFELRLRDGRVSAIRDFP